MLYVPAVCSDGFMGLGVGNLPVYWTMGADREQHDLVTQDLLYICNTLHLFISTFRRHFCFGDSLCLFIATTALDSVWAFLRPNAWWQMLDSMMHTFSRSATDICI